MADQQMVQSVPHRMRGNGSRPRNAIRLEQNVIEEKQNMQMLVDKIWLSMPEMNRGPGYHTYHRTCSHLKRTKRVGQMTISTYQSSNCAIKVYCYRI